MRIELKAKTGNHLAEFVFRGYSKWSSITKDIDDIWTIKLGEASILVWDQMDQFAFLVSGNAYNNAVKGLCGNNDGKVENDREGPNGPTQTDQELFDSWSNYQNVIHTCFLFA